MHHRRYYSLRSALLDLEANQFARQDHERSYMATVNHVGVLAKIKGRMGGMYPSQCAVQTLIAIHDQWP